MSRFRQACVVLLILASIIGGVAARAGTPTDVRAASASFLLTATSSGIDDGTPLPPPTQLPTPPPRPTRTPIPPSVVRTIAAVADTYVRAGTYATTNYGAEPALVIKDGSTSYDRRAFIRFDLRGVATTTVRRAMLKLYVTDLPNGGPAPFRVAAVASDGWSEGAITWNTQPMPGSAGMSYQVTARGWYTLDLTGYVNTQLAGDKLVSIALFDDTAAGRMLRISSREGTYPPTLEIAL
jgi:endoglucanase